MALPYNNNIPQSGDIPANSQSQIQTNFASIQTLIDVDHADFAAIPYGQHNQVSFVTQSPAPTFSAGQVGAYSFLNSTTNKNELYINKTNASGVVQVASTASLLGITAAPTPGTYGNAGWTMLPSGIKLVWGVGQGSASGAVTITLTGAQAFATTMLSCQCTIVATDTTNYMAFCRLVAGTLSTNSFNVIVTNSGGFTTNHFTYLCIGY